MNTPVPKTAAMSVAGHKIVLVQLDDRSYPVHIGRGLIQNIQDFVPSDLHNKTLFVLTDENARPYAEALGKALEANCKPHSVHMLPLPPGEETKSFRWYEKVLNWMLDSGVTRSSVLFAVGGGVVGDLGGFAAATVLRGIGFVQVPTTLLAQVDSGVGGKTAIDMPQGKNLVGAFYQPSAVICDLNTLETLGMRQRLAGYAEIIKYGLINDEEFFIWLEKNGKALCDLSPDALANAIEVACRKKAEIVSQDEREADQRRLLNLGHTFAHAMELASGFSPDFLHGEAVAVGLVQAAHLSVRLGYCRDEVIDRIRTHLRHIGLPTSIKDVAHVVPADPARMVRMMYADKKAEAGGLTFVLMRGIGQAFVERRVGEEDVLAVLRESINGA